MKKAILVVLLTLSALNMSQAQEWMTSFELARRLALVKNKMLFVVWEDATLYEYPVLINDKDGNLLVVNLFNNQSLNKIIWEYFVPVIVNESSYPDLLEEIKGKRNVYYINKFNDDSIKIMDINGNIVNTNSSETDNNLLNFASFIAKYSMNTAFLNQELISYSTEKNFTTSFFLASKYIDYASLSQSIVKSEIIELSDIYLNEAFYHLQNNSDDKELILLQAISLLKLKQLLVLNKPKKVIRQLKKINKSEIYRVNKDLNNFLFYTAFKLMNDENNASLWKTKVSLLDLKKAKIIINNNS